MTYFPDLSPYSYTQAATEAGALLNVGWLDKDHDYPTGPAQESLYVALLDRLASVSNRTRGYHLCNLCGARQPIRVRHNGREFVLGDAEIHVVGPDNVVYIAPTLIVHYIGQHAYLPPAEFVKALLQNASEA